MANILEIVAERDLHYSRQRQRNRVFTAVLSFFAKEAEARGFSKKDVAEALDREPSQISRWLSRPSNMSLDTISDLLLAIGAEMDIRVVKFKDHAPANYVHPLLARIEKETGSSPRQGAAKTRSAAADSAVRRRNFSPTATDDTASFELLDE